MNYKNLSTKTWKELSTSGEAVSGYQSLLLHGECGKNIPLHLFIDENGSFHFAIETIEKNVNNPQVNGLTIKVQNYRMNDSKVMQMVDLCCNISAYLEEFTGVIKEIAECIIEKDENPVEAVNRIVHTWKVFWSNQSRQMLSEEELIGLICELVTLKKLCGLNALSALNSWRGPLRSKTDFCFTSWDLEVKATRNPQIVHTINGLEQLKPSADKSLAFISFFVSVADNQRAISLPALIGEITSEYFSTRADLIVKFNELLMSAGYNPLFAEQYSSVKIEILQSSFYIVDDAFPKLTSEHLSTSLNNRISNVSYDISLEGISGLNFSEINWGDYFF